MHEELLSALIQGPGLILVTGPAGQGKTTAIEGVLADSRCPRDIAFLGDIRGDVQEAARAVQLARSQMVVAVLRIQHAAGAFARLLDMGVPASDLVDVVRTVFTTRILRLPSEVLLLHERLVVTPAIRGLIVAGADSEAIHRRAIADGMQSLRKVGNELVRAGRVPADAIADLTPDD